MLSSYWMECPHANCHWSGSLVPSHLRGGEEAVIASMQRAWFRCPRCQADWQVQIANDKVTIVPALSADAPSADGVGRIAATGEDSTAP